MPIVRATILTRIIKSAADDEVNKKERKCSMSLRRLEERRTSLYQRRSSLFGPERKSILSFSSGSSNASVINELKIKVSFQLICTSGSGDVFFKPDGNRFTDEYTLKLVTSTEYNIKMETEPAIKLRFIKIAGKEFPFKPINNHESEEKSLYQFVWSTAGIDVTMRRHRTNIPCAIRFKHYRQLNFKLQSKFYTANEIKRVAVGKKLKSIVLECTIGRGVVESTVDKILLS